MATELAPPRLAVYGSLAPGERHHDQVEHLGGTWQPGTVRGELLDRGWGARLGYPGFIADAEGPPVPVMVLTSGALAGAWEALDRFEGAYYRRTRVTVELENGESVEAAIYELRTGAAS
ncbi:MAG TPA: gamma-glutamylcyclotransferase family protein [Acidimicrobiia bacterium]|jgi:gamma-glutamylcyclotransferase (GGCT)/AIG2-like uncharacterized protein YtfP|nr:gamma-glutamylcyclotransferase family protein [Acidimicrobiia bacterium]